MYWPMKKIFLIVFLVTIGFLLYDMNFSTPWLTDFEMAKKQSKESGKPILLYFSGSDWCTICIKMKKTILETETFQKYAEENLVLMVADFPRTKKNKLDPNIKKQNEELAEKYNQEGKFPYIILMNPDGKILKEWTGYSNATPEQFVDQLKKCK
jgi:thioredoxin-related protein